MKKIILLLVVIISFYNVDAQIRIGKTIFPYEVMYQDSVQLKLNGGGVRELLWIDMYSGGLYLQQRTKNPLVILDADETMAIRLDIVSKFVTQEKFIKAVQEGFKKATFGNTESLDERINKFMRFFSEPIIKKDVFELVYMKGTGVTSYKNDIKLGVIEGRDFKYALFKIWLGDEPASEAIKQGMLGYY